MNPDLAALQVETIHFVDASTVEFKVAGGGGPAVINATYRLDLETGAIQSSEDNP